MKSFLMIISVLIFTSLGALTEEAGSRGQINTDSQNRTTGSAPAQNSDGATNVVSSSSAADIRNSASRAGKSNSSTATLGKVVGVANIAYGGYNMKLFAASCATFGGCKPGFLAKGVLHFAMGALSFKQSKANSDGAYAAGLTGMDTSSWGNPFGDPNAPGGDEGGGSNGVDHMSTADSGKDKDLKSLVNTGSFNDLKSKLFTTGIGGVKMDPKSGIITDTNTGKTYDPSKLATEADMAAAGFSSADIGAVMAASKKAELEAMKKLGITEEGIGAATAENGYTEGGGGVLSGSAQNTNGLDGASGYGGRKLASVGGPTKAPSNQIAGLSKNFNGERIGVSAENIFNMMNRRYKTKEKQNSFFTANELTKLPQ